MKGDPPSRRLIINSCILLHRKGTIFLFNSTCNEKLLYNNSIMIAFYIFVALLVLPSRAQVRVGKIRFPIGCELVLTFANITKHFLTHYTIVL